MKALTFMVRKAGKAPKKFMEYSCALRFFFSLGVWGVFLFLFIDTFFLFFY